MLNILHVCSINNDPANGMFQVIPNHVRSQHRLANTCLLNLDEYQFDFDDEILSFCKDDIIKFGFKKIFAQIGKLDLVVFHGIYLLDVILFWMRYINKKIPYLIIPHACLTVETQSKNHIKKVIFNKLIGELFCKKAIAIQFLSVGEQKKSISSFNSNSIVLPNGIFLPKETIDSRKKNKKNVRVIYIGRYDIYHKGLDYLIEAINEKKEELLRRGISFDIYGDKTKNNYEEFQLLIDKYELGKLVKCNGPIYGKEKEKELLASDYFIQTSRLEGLPMGLIEAESYGLPLLITEGTNLDDDVKMYKNGFVGETSTVGVCQLLDNLLNTNLDYEYMVSGSLKASQKYEWDRVAEDTIKQYEKLLNESN